MVLYPLGYGSTMVTMRRLRELHEPGMHPNFAAPLFAWIESMGGEIGIGGGWRATQPTLPGFAPDGRSFHQWQTFRSGLRAYAAVDLVRRNPAGGQHVTLRWSDSDTAPRFGLHTFITKPPEPWHMQNSNIRGWQTWMDQGRPDPVLPPAIKPPPPPPLPQGVVVTSSTAWQARRILDSRWWDEAGRFGDARPGDNGVRNIPCPEAKGAGAVTVTVTAVLPKVTGFVTLFRAGGSPPPQTSHLNYSAGTLAIANTTTVPVADNGSFQVYVSGDSHLVIDLVGVHS
jgi:hypothetical protein